MNRRRGTLAGNPLLIGAVTTLIIVVAVYISYNANHGLPFTPTYNIRVELPTASNLFKGNEVRVDGRRVGIVEKLVPYQNPKTGRLTAIAYLKLEKNAQPLPANTTAIVQSVSSVGLKYLRLERGSSRAMIPQGGTIPVSQTRQPVNIGELFDMFTPKTREANKKNLIAFGNGLVGRGVGLNETLKTLRPLVAHLRPVMENLASPQTDLGNLWEALDRAAREAAPVAAEQGLLYKELDTFFGEWARVAPSLEEAIAEGPSALRQAIHSLPFEAPFIRKSAEFMRLLRPSAKALKTAAPPLGKAFAAGAVNLRAAKALNSAIASSSQEVKRFAEDPVVTAGLEDLTATAKAAGPLIGGLASEQTTCNYITLAFRNVASLLSESVGVGTLARASPVLAPKGPNNEGYPASAPANGPSEEMVLGKVIDSNHLHYNPYPSVSGAGGLPACEAGNERYAVGKAVIGHAESVGNGREFTNREEDLYGHPYPESTLKDLGVGKAKSASAGSASAKSASAGSASGKGASARSASGKGASARGASTGSANK